MRSGGRGAASRTPGAHGDGDGDGGIAWYRDTFTGNSMERPAWKKLMNAVLWGEVSRIVVCRLDRLGRTAKG